MKKLNSKGYSVVELLVIFVVIGLIIGAAWYIWRARQVNKIESYSDCVKANGQLTDTEIPGIHGECKIYGQTYLEDGYVKWDLGQRFTKGVHDDKLQPSIVENASAAPKELVSALQYGDNGDCAINDHKTLAVFKVIKVVQNKYAKLAYGCTDAPLDAYMIAINTKNGWESTSPTNQFTDSGTPSCALVNYFNITKTLEPKCFKISNNQTVLVTNSNP